MGDFLAMRRIWFNHWFSAAYNIISMAKENNPDFHIIGTNENARSVLARVCDEWYQEPVLKGSDYVSFALDFCKAHKVDAFIPRREMLSISKHKKDFESIGVKVMVEDYSIADILNHKNRAYEYLIGKGVSSVPKYFTVTSVEQFEASYEALKQEYKQVCIKFVHDEGGKSFRLIDNQRKGYTSLFKKQNTRMTFAAIREALAERDSFSPLMVMPYLPDEEISADCLMTEQGLIMLPRVKDASRVEKLVFNDTIVEKIEEIYDAVDLAWPCNIQLKYLDGKPYFLEVNTRMSGGVHMACLAGGVNIPDIAINKLFGVNKNWSIDKTETYVSQVEIPVLL